MDKELYHDDLANSYEEEEVVEGFWGWSGFIVSLIIRIATRLVLIPVQIALWTINFVKSLVGAFMLYIVGKGAIWLFVFLGSGIMYELKIIKLETVHSVSGMVGNFFFSDGGDIASRTFPHGAIELVIIIIMALGAATFATFGNHDK